MHIEALALAMPAVAAHPNRAPFHGVLTLVDAASDRAPSGARGRRVLLPAAVAEAALPSLLGMALDYTPALDGHDARRKAGVITAAEIVGRELRVRGFLYARDFPEVVAALAEPGGRLGLSYEVADAEIADVRAAVWRFTRVTFTGAAILRRDRAAYEQTSITLGESTMAKDQMMDPQVIAALAGPIERVAAAAVAVSALLERVEAQQEEFAAKIEKIVAAVEGEPELRARIGALEQENESLREQARAPHARKTLPALAQALLAKIGAEGKDGIEAAALEAALRSLPVEQRIAVKSQLARAGMIE